MKKRYIIITYIVISTLFIAISLVKMVPKAMDGAVDKAIEQNQDFVHGYNICDIALEGKKYKKAAECFGELLTRYDRPDVRYSYALALANIKEFEKAKLELEKIIDNKQNQPEIIEASKNLNKQIDDALKILREQTTNYSDIKEKNVDVGDYFSDLEEYTLWEKPTDIKVYIKDDPKNLYKKAFAQWNGTLEGVAYFKFVEREKDADITCSFVKTIKANEGGVTEWLYLEKDGKKYFDKATIKIAKYSPHNGNLFSDSQLYSIILHEIGHALGITSHSPFKGDIMYFSTDNYLNEKGLISKRDANTVKRIYKK